VGEMIGKIFLQLDEQPYPTAMFSDEKEAEKWLNKLCYNTYLME